MKDKYQQIQEELKLSPRRWLVTGCAGFIGSNLLEMLLKLDQVIVGLDNFSTGKQANLDEVESLVTREQWKRFKFVEGDICDLDMCRRCFREPVDSASASAGRAGDQRTDTPLPAPIDFVLHQAALGSVPRSIEDPIRTNASNVIGFLNILVAARDAGVKRFVYAASSSSYGDHPVLPRVEDVVGKPLSPYAVTKYVNELYANVFGRCYGVEWIGLRYFNVFGPRQNPDGAYAAVIPKWIAAILRNEQIYINGDGETSRDFCYVANAVQANILAATEKELAAANQIYNVAVGDRTTLNELFELLRGRYESEISGYRRHGGNFGGDTDATGNAAELTDRKANSPIHRPARDGDVRHSQADISKARQLLGYAPTYRISEGLNQTFAWYVRSIEARTDAVKIQPHLSSESFL